MHSAAFRCWTGAVLLPRIVYYLGIQPLIKVNHSLILSRNLEIAFPRFLFTAS
jgi:hypothetical protein